MSRRDLKRQLSQNRDSLMQSLLYCPDDVEAREPLWMQRHNLLKRLDSR